MSDESLAKTIYVLTMGTFGLVGVVTGAVTTMHSLTVGQHLWAGPLL